MLHSQTTGTHLCRVGIGLCYRHRARMSDRQAATRLQLRPPHLRCRWINHCAVLRREQVIIVGILTSVCQSEGQLCLRGRAMLICSAGKKKLHHSPLKLELAPLCSRGYVFTLELLHWCICVCVCAYK